MNIIYFSLISFEVGRRKHIFLWSNPPPPIISKETPISVNNPLWPIFLYVKLWTVSKTKPPGGTCPKRQHSKTSKGIEIKKQPDLRSKRFRAGGRPCTSRCEASPCSASKPHQWGAVQLVLSNSLPHRVHLSQHRPLGEEQRLPGVHHDQVEEGAPGVVLERNQTEIKL